jgi:hypothetical protein
MGILSLIGAPGLHNREMIGSTDPLERIEQLISISVQAGFSVGRQDLGRSLNGGRGNLNISHPIVRKALRSCQLSEVQSQSGAGY